MITTIKYNFDYKQINLDTIIIILDYFNIEYKYDKQKKIITGCCPIHFNSDNKNALYLRYDSGIWKCFTHHCEQIFGTSIFGLIKGLLSVNELDWKENGDRICKTEEVNTFLKKFNINNIKKYNKKNTQESDRIDFIKNKKENANDTNKVLNISQMTLRQSILIPSEYYLKRGFKEDTLIKYDIGDCYNQKKEMKNRAIIPIYDDNYKYIIGCTGRSIYEKCLVCGYYHAKNELCPQKCLYQYSKWLHNHNLNKRNVLYNYWFAKDEILKTNKIIIVESPGNVWKLYEAGIKNMVAILGCNLSKHQLNLIHQSGALEIILLLDNDEAGHNTKEFLKQYLSKMSYKITTPTIYTNDIAEMKLEDIKKCLM